jgi:hypothetical protein
MQQLPAVSTNPNGPWAVRASIQDSAVDDGETSVVSVTMDWSIAHIGGVTTGSTPLLFRGGLFYRADLTPPPGVVTNGATVSFTLTAVDWRGNSTTTPQQTFWICGLQSYALGLGCTNTSLLQGSGSASPGGVATFAWSAAAPSVGGLLALSLARAHLVLPQGILVVDPGVLITLVPIGTDASGSGALGVPIPVTPPLVGLRVAFQALFDPPLTLTNGVDLVICP